MAGDGVSLQTNISQLGSVAKAQARGQQTHAVAPGQKPAQDEDVQPLQKVKENEKTDPEGLDPEKRRGRDRRDGDRRPETAAGAEESDTDAEETDADDAPWLGGHIDIKA